MSTEKTAADVADKALDRVSGALGSMVDAAKKIAPHAWEVLVRQQVVEGVTYSVVCVVLTVAMGLLSAFCYRKQKELSVCDELPVQLGMMLCGFACLVSLLCLPGNLLQALNPEYYAIKMMLQGVK